ncbi:DUF4878 domain-containing protein [Paenibacillus polymyxa]|uniref:DUF4878 domain-containing protein n=1 Tax=Paenibacillus polymyxa TaxID=1406 RepID=UPI001119C591|nr:DUF4878 domain-containing protein [Paenibacillus polymyxa]QDA30258.1 DUF4878 domain-containing protein [Paenibacillus polymyxa]
MKFLSFNGKIKKTLLLVPLLAMSVFPGLTGAEGVSNQELAKQAIKNFVEAGKSGDGLEASKWVIDNRFNNKEEQVKVYNESAKDSPFSDVNITDVASASDDTYKATVELTRKDDGSINTVTYPIIKKDDSWKVLIDGQQETTSKKVEKLLRSQEENSTSLVKPMSTEIAKYGVGGKEWVDAGDHTYSDQFNMSTDRVGITGWQQIPGSTSKCSVRYSVVSKGIWSDEPYGQAFHTGFNYWNGDAFYEYVYTGRAHSGVVLKVTNEEIGNSVKVRGHVYEN